jgi:hypothetical protein
MANDPAPAMSVEFPPARVGRRRRRIDPTVPAIALVVAIVAVGVAKPWSDNQPAVVPPAATEAPPAPAAVVESEWLRVVRAVRPHDGWGIRAIVDRPSGFVESWAPAIGGTGDGTFASAFLPDDPVVALGVTAPRGTRVEAVRMWRELRVGNEWLLARPVLTDPIILQAPETGAAFDDGRWPPGRYRVDVLVGKHIRRIALTLPDASGTIPLGLSSRRLADGLVGVRDTDPSFVRTGLFAAVDGRGVALRALPGRPLDEAAAWSAAASGDHGNASPRVAIVTIPRVTGLGVMLTVRAQVRSAMLERLAPGPLRETPAAIGGVSSMRGQIPYVAFEMPEGGAIQPGVYAVSVDWTDESGDHARTWHVELRPAG